MPEFNRHYVAAIAECDLHAWNPSHFDFHSFREIDIAVTYEGGDKWNDENIVVAAYFDNRELIEFSETYYFGGKGYADGITDFPDAIEIGQWVARKIISMRESWIG
jgi:hypothetical protein